MTHDPVTSLKALNEYVASQASDLPCSESPMKGPPSSAHQFLTLINKSTLDVEMVKLVINCAIL